MIRLGFDWSMSSREQRACHRERADSTVFCREIRGSLRVISRPSGEIHAFARWGITDHPAARRVRMAELLL
jgi:hypothetical protein